MTEAAAQGTWLKFGWQGWDWELRSEGRRVVLELVGATDEETARRLVEYDLLQRRGLVRHKLTQLVQRVVREGPQWVWEHRLRSSDDAAEMVSRLTSDEALLRAFLVQNTSDIESTWMVMSSVGLMSPPLWR